MFSILLSGAGASSLIGLNLSGPIVKRTGVPVWYLVTGIIVIVIGTSAFLIPASMQIERGKPGSQAENLHEKPFQKDPTPVKF